MTTLGDTSEPTNSAEAWSGNTWSLHGHVLTMPSGGPWKVTKVAVWAAGYGGNVTARNILWSGSSGLILGDSADYTMIDRPFSPSGSDLYDKAIDDGGAAVIVSGGQSIIVGFQRSDSGGAFFGKRSTGSHRDKDAASYPDDMISNTTHATGAMGAYITYELANTLPTAPTWTSPAQNAVLTDTTPDLVFVHNDANGDPPASYDVEVDTTTGFGTEPDWASLFHSAANQTGGISGDTITYTLPALTRGTYYAIRVRTNDGVGDGAWSATRFVRVNQLPTIAARDPASADFAIIHNLAELALWTAGAAHAKPRFSWQYNDPDADASASFRVRVYKAPSGGSTIYDSGVIASILAAGATMIHDLTQAFVRGVAKACVNVIQGNSSTDANNYVTASVTLRAGRLYLLSVENSKGSATADPISSVTGGAGVPSFTSRGTVPYNTNLNRVSIWSAAPTADYTGTLTINFGGVTQTGAVWSIDEYVGIDTTTAHGIVQSATGTGNSATALATLAAFAASSNPTFGASGHAAATATTPGSGFSELADQTAATPAQALHTEHRVDSDTTADATFTSAQWGMCALELQAAEWWWTVEVWDTTGESSGESSRTAFKVYWAQGLYEHNPGASSSAWSFANGAVAAGTQAAFLFRSATSSGGEAASGKTAFSTAIGSVTIQAWAQVLVRLATTISGTQPALPDMTFSYLGAATQPDRWVFSPSAEWALDESVRRYGARALKCSVQSGTLGDRTAYAYRKTSGDDIPVVPSTKYIGSIFVKTNAPLTGGSVRLELWSAGGVALLASSASVTDTSAAADGWQRLTVTYTTATGDTAIRFLLRYTRTSGVTETFWIDAGQFEEGQVATTWRAGQIGKALVIDVNGIVVDGFAGGIGRFRGTLGGARDTFEVGPHALLLGGDVELYSPTADIAQFDDQVRSSRTNGTDLAFSGKRAADSNPRWTVSADGTINFYASPGDANPVLRINPNGTIEWGVGGGTAVDLALSRAAAGVLLLAAGDRLRHDPVGVVATRSATQSITQNSVTALQMSATDISDAWGFHDPASNNSRLTVPSGMGGTYVPLGMAALAGHTGTRNILGFGLNGAAMADPQQTTHAVVAATQMSLTHVGVPMELAATDYVELMIFQNSAAAVNAGPAWAALFYLGEVA